MGGGSGLRLDSGGPRRARALLRAARGIENAAVRDKVTRNVVLACRHLPEAKPELGEAEAEGEFACL